MELPFSNQFFTIAIDVGRVPKRAAFFKGSIENLTKKIKGQIMARRPTCPHLKSLLVRVSLSIEGGYAHSTKADFTDVVFSNFACSKRHDIEFMRYPLNEELLIMHVGRQCLSCRDHRRNGKCEPFLCWLLSPSDSVTRCSSRNPR